MECSTLFCANLYMNKAQLPTTLEHYKLTRN